MSLSRQLQPLLLASGLNETEAHLYLELLKKSAENAWELVQRTGFSKSAVYRGVERLTELKLLKRENGLHARSLKTLVAELQKDERTLRKTVFKLRQIAPFLRFPHEEIDSVQSFYTPDQIRDAYLFMADHPYSTNFDFGDFEHFVPVIGGLPVACQFRTARIQHAKHSAVCTTFGKNSAYFCTAESEHRFANKVKFLPLDFKGQFIIFSDTNDYVLFNHFENPENPYAVLVKSRAIAESERARFDHFSRQVGK